MKRALAAWFTSASIARVTKSMNMISTTGRRPLSAAPTAADTIDASEMGVSITRAAPNFSRRQRVALNEPPAAAMSSPSSTTRSSASMLSRKASATAWA